jgi:predicted outer membrane repeat protein
MKFHRMLGLLYACALCATVARGATIHVPGDYPSIQAGIYAASAGDTVMLAWGVYTEIGIQMKSGVHLTSETGLPESVTIDGTGLGTVLFCDGVDSTAVVSGLTITGGSALVAGGGIDAYQSSLLFEDVRVVGNHASQWGGGMWCGACPGLRMNRVAFVDNSSHSGGGLHCYSARPQLTDVVFAGNTAVGDGGGAVFNYRGGATLVECEFTGNSAERGGGAFCTESVSPKLFDVVFSGNSATRGGGMACVGGSWPEAMGCTFYENTASNGGGAVYSLDSHPSLVDVEFLDNTAAFNGGALYATNSMPEVTGGLFVGNAASGGGAISLDDCIASVLSSTFWLNEAPYGGALYSSGSSMPVVSWCTFVSNSSTEGTAVFSGGDSDVSLDHTILAMGVGGSAVGCWSGGTVSLTCSDVHGNAGGDWTGCIAGQSAVGGNISAAPLFCNPEVGDFSLRADSPCAPEANPSCGLIGAWDVGCEVTAVRQMTWGRVKAAYR